MAVRPLAWGRHGGVAQAAYRVGDGRQRYAISSGEWPYRHPERGPAMPAFSLEPEQTDRRDRLRTLAADHLRPLADKGEPGHVNRPLVAELGRLGLLGRLFTSGALDLCLMRESLAQVSTEAETALALQGLGAHPVHAHGTAAQRERWLPRVADGEAVAAFALSEPGAGSDAAALALRADEDGSGGWRLTGEKCWISNAPE